MLNLRIENYFKLVLSISLISILAAYYIEHILGHKPCNLCLIERIPYLSAVVVISLIFITKKFERLFSAIVLLFFMFGSLVSFYHVGIEQGFFDESLVCNLENSTESLSKDQLLKQLKNVPISCKEVTFRFLGLSLATINTIISIILSGIMLKIVRNYGQNK